MPTYRLPSFLTATALSVAALFAGNTMAQTVAAAADAAPAAAEAAAPDAPALPIASGPISPPGTELLHNATANVLQRDYDTALLKIPANIRGGFGVDPNRINTLLQNILVDKTLAAQARKDGIDKDPQVQAQIQQEVDKILTGIVIERETAQWKRLFNALPNTDQTAREAWITHPEKYTTPPQYRLTVILFGTPQHSVAEARRMADDARAKILAGADMATLAREQSDDPAAKANGGQIDWTPPKARTSRSRPRFRGSTRPATFRPRSRRRPATSSFASTARSRAGSCPSTK